MNIKKLVNKIPDKCMGSDGCPSLLELDNGDFLAIGKDVTELYQCKLKEYSTGCSNAERIIQIPKDLLNYR